MPRYELIISPALDGRTVRQAAMGGLHLSGGQFKRAKFHGALMVDGSPVQPVRKKMMAPVKQVGLRKVLKDVRRGVKAL